jgi:uncharacterized membrane protein
VVETGRLETFCDGVFAIAITLLILGVELPHDVASGELGERLMEQWPTYLAYILSFVTIGIIWVNHHTLLRHFDRADRTFLFVNVLFLMCVAFIPFPTGLVAEHVHSEPAAVAYGLTLTATALCFNAIWHYGRLKLLRADADRREVSGITRSYIPGPFMYGTATLVAFASPEASVALYGFIAAVYVVSSSLFGQAEE